MSSLYCDDGLLAAFPLPAPPAPKPERGAPWRPPDTSRDVCQRCGRLCWQHRSYPPALADEIDRAIYAAAFVAALGQSRLPDNGAAARVAMSAAEEIVELHRRARSGT